MAIVGLLILAAALAVGVETSIGNRAGVGLEAFGQIYVLPVSVIFLVGATLATIALLGLFMVTGAAQRRRATRTEAKHRMRSEETESRLIDTDRTNADLVEENDRLRAELTAERRAAATMGGVTVPPGAGDVAYGDQVSDAVRSDTISDTGKFEPYPADRGGSTIDVSDSRHDEHRDDKASMLGRFRSSR